MARGPRVTLPFAPRRAPGPAGSTLPRPSVMLALGARAEGAKPLSRLARPQRHYKPRPGVDRALPRHFAASPLSPKGRTAVAHSRRAPRPVGRTGREQPTKHVPGHPRLRILLRCVATSTDRQPRRRPQAPSLQRDVRAEQANGSPDLGRSQPDVRTEPYRASRWGYCRG